MCIYICDYVQQHKQKTALIALSNSHVLLDMCIEVNTRTSAHWRVPASPRLQGSAGANCCVIAPTLPMMLLNYTSKPLVLATRHAAPPSAVVVIKGGLRGVLEIFAELCPLWRVIRQQLFQCLLAHKLKVSARGVGGGGGGAVQASAARSQRCGQRLWVVYRVKQA
jgi:hypothetical protein